MTTHSQPTWLPALQNTFGFNSLREGQQPVVEAILAGRSAAAIFPTGSGKSLCYQLPALLLPHLTLVVSPLLALMQDQVSFLRSKGVAAASLDSTLSREELQSVQQGVREGAIKILFISVERLKNERFREFIRHVAISLLVVDEAHCISEWGHNFRPDYLKLPEWRRQFNIPQSLLLTATATEKVVHDMRRHFEIAPSDVVSTGFYRKNLRLLVQPTAIEARIDKCAEWLNHRIKKGEAFGSVIYVTQQNTADEVAQALKQRISVPVEAYHAGMQSENRQAIQQRFMTGTTPCIVATIAFGMGIDKSNIRQVLHYDLPKSIENYSQEIGRAGRDGRAADCVLLADLSGLTVLENYTYGDTPTLAAITRLLDTIQQDTVGINHEGQGRWETMMLPLSNQTDIRPLPLKTLLVHLEMAGYLTPLFSYYAEYRFRLESESSLLAHFDAERQQFLQTIFQCSKKGRTWYSLDVPALEQAAGPDARLRAVRALEYCFENDWLTLEIKQMTEVYQVQAWPHAEQSVIAEKLYRTFLEHQESDIQRLHNMIAVFQSQQCLSRQLAVYFNDHSMKQDCGHCSVCMGRWQAWPRPVKHAQQYDVAQVVAYLSQFEQAYQTMFKLPSEPEAKTRFLCGMTSPWLTRLKARGIANYGCLESAPYATVLGIAKEL
ncbi:RecQ family ATP-dependent DNA helicase [Thalassolituus oleivorans]|uniref:RecQ family ATP-dependent DNA helicase n=1 Tax=Thalassolituus oleivorans TaxID=187493 RepID=UPI001CE37182|nr:RecQ family ATP-dependent DNA helicase [Thalassolituus oleivorans]MCA6129263.1 ATP-dependent DNA helicase RecQ [Thalassolituus oleivorans 4BN06-13]